MKIGAITKIFTKPQLLICAWVSDNSPLKSQFFALFENTDKEELIKIGKGYDKTTETYKRLAIKKWSVYSYTNDNSFVWFGWGSFVDGRDL